MTARSVPITNSKQMTIGRFVEIWVQKVAILIDFARIVWNKTNSRRKSILCYHIALQIERFTHIYNRTALLRSWYQRFDSLISLTLYVLTGKFLFKTPFVTLFYVESHRAWNYLFSRFVEVLCWISWSNPIFLISFWCQNLLTVKWYWRTCLLFMVWLILRFLHHITWNSLLWLPSHCLIWQTTCHLFFWLLDYSLDWHTTSMLRGLSSFWAIICGWNLGKVRLQNITVPF